MMSEGVQSPSAASSTIRSYLARSSRTVQCLLGVDKPGLLAGRLAGSQELLAVIAEFGTANKIAVAGAGAVFRANPPRPPVSGTSRQSLDFPTRDRESPRLNSSHQYASRTQFSACKKKSIFLALSRKHLRSRP